MRLLVTSLTAAAALAVAAPALAQTAPDPAMADPAVAATTPVEDDDNDFPWGLLGLIGLAGLLGRKRDDRRYDTNPRT
jgi:MYXO-CTERM domain-containing protein